MVGVGGVVRWRETDEERGDQRKERDREIRGHKEVEKERKDQRKERSA